LNRLLRYAYLSSVTVVFAVHSPFMVRKSGFIFSDSLSNSILFSSAHCYHVYGKPILITGYHTPLNMEWY
jgi:hypothetical protein